MKFYYLFSIFLLITSYCNYAMEEASFNSRFQGRPIHFAAAENKLDTLEKILEQDKTEINAKDNYYCTALHIACSYGHTETVNLLLNHCANIEVTDHFGTTPLMVASAQGYAEIVQLLLKCGANPHKKDRYGEDAISIAENDEVRACFIVLNHGL
jgi:ankyrin repeat protein